MDHLNGSAAAGLGAGHDRVDSYVPSTFVIESSTGKPTLVTANSMTLKLEDQDIAFILGTKGETKRKLAVVSECNFHVDEKKYTLTIEGTEEKRRRAHEYVDMVLAQRRGGVVKIDLTQVRPDLTVLQVPADCVGYVTGSGGKVLRNLESEWGTLMFFLNPSQENNTELTENLVIFGQRRGRVGAALKVMSAVEHKKKGYFVQNDRFVFSFENELDADPNGFCMEQSVLQDADFSYALGKEGKTRKKLAKASGCILEYVGLIAIMVGTGDERSRVKDYLRWLLMQRTGNCDVDDSNRTDVTVMPVEARYVGWVTGVQGKNFREIEEKTGCYLFTNRSSGNKLEGDQLERIMIFSHDRRSRDRAENEIRRSIDEKKDADANGSRLSRRDKDDRGGRKNRSPSPHRGGRGRRDSRDRRDRSSRRRRDDSPRRRDDSPRRRDDSPKRERGRDSRRRDDSPRRRRDDDRGRGRGRSRDRR